MRENANDTNIKITQKLKQFLYNELCSAWTKHLETYLVQLPIMVQFLQTSLRKGYEAPQVSVSAWLLLIYLEVSIGI